MSAPAMFPAPTKPMVLFCIALTILRQSPPLTMSAELRKDGRERRLRRARYADQHDVGLLEVARLFAVVALDGKLDRLDAAEVLLGKREHAARHVDRLSIEKVPELADERPDDVDRVH